MFLGANFKHRMLLYCARVLDMFFCVLSSVLQRRSSVGSSLAGSPALVRGDTVRVDSELDGAAYMFSARALRVIRNKIRLDSQTTEP